MDELQNAISVNYLDQLSQFDLSIDPPEGAPLGDPNYDVTKLMNNLEQWSTVRLAISRRQWLIVCQINTLYKANGR